jgi:hypothetical protein
MAALAVDESQPARGMHGSRHRIGGSGFQVMQCERFLSSDRTAIRTVQEAAVQISNWTDFEKNTLRGFFDLTLPSGMIIRGCTLHSKGAERWIGLPAEKFTDEEGRVGWKAIIRFVDRTIADEFRDRVLQALDLHLRPLPAAKKPAETEVSSATRKTASMHPRQ